MDFLKAEIASKKRQLDRPSPSPSADSSSSSAPPPAKYLKRSELDRIRKDEQERELKLKEQERKAKLYGSKPAPTPPASTSTSLAVPSTSTSTSTSASPAPGSPLSALTPEPLEPTEPTEKFLVSNADAIRRLRQKGAPIRLFGESDKDRRLRLRALELLERETESGQGERGQRNEFQRALEEGERKRELERGRTGEKEEKKKSGGKGKGKAVAEEEEGAEGTEEGEEGEEGGKAVEKKDKKERTEPNPKDEEVLVDLSLVKTNPHKVYPQIYHAFKRVLKEWEASLDARPDSIKRSTQGKVAAATQATSAEYLKPLFKSLRKRDLPPDVLPNLAQIAFCMQTREYLRANDAYLRLSIGNAPWPIGVTMVGIHERSGREKIFSNNVAHVLNDETSRKYIQSLKRLLTFAQAVRPPDDVSQKMG